MIITYEVGSGLYINLTNRCNNRCVFCVRDEESKGGYGDLWLEREPEIEEICTDIAKRDISKYSEIVFCGFGEPTMRLDAVCAVADFIKEHYIETPIRLNTNGLANAYYNKDITPSLAGRIDTVSISLNTPDAEKYEKICRPFCKDKAHGAVIDFGKKAKEHVKRVIFTVVGTTISDDEIEKCRSIAEECGVSFRVREFIK